MSVGEQKLYGTFLQKSVSIVIPFRIEKTLSSIFEYFDTD